MFEDISTGRDENGVVFSLIARRLKAMADPARIRILHSLCGGERNVSQLVSGTGFSQANVSKHLRILREEGLVEARRDRKMVFYKLTSDMSREICDRICRSLEQDQIKGNRLLDIYGRNGK
jgi:DNA-binding transcriptional ArsR family regulator